MKKGFTTGTCAQAATKAACIMLTKRKPVDYVFVLTPSGKRLRISIADQKISRDFAKCSVIKDAGDDPDVTDGAKICAEVSFSDRIGVTIKGAQGVGKATLPGLAIAVGEWAINPTPRRMILEEASKFLSNENGLEVTISIPKGKELAKKTYNPKLGIIGGISILGTTGIVEPRSLDAYKQSLTLQLNILKAQGYSKAVFVLGYVGERFCKEKLKLKESSVIKIGDHIGFIIKECVNPVRSKSPEAITAPLVRTSNGVKKNIKEILLIGHIGKLIKVTCGQFNTHYSFGDRRLETIARYAEHCGANKNTSKKILQQETAEAAIAILREAGLNAVFGRIAKDAARKSRELADNKITVNCILLSLDGEVLAKTNEK